MSWMRYVRKNGGPSDGDTDIRTGYRGCSDHTFETMELSGGDCTVPCIWPVCMEPDESRKETGKDGTGDYFGRDHTGRRKGSIEKLRWEKAHITEELKEKTIQYDNLGEQLAELDEINEQSREYEMKTPGSSDGSRASGAAVRSNARVFEKRSE